MKTLPGIFYSKYYCYFLVKGNVKIRLEDDIESVKDMDKDIDIEMEYTGLYKNGVIEKLKLKKSNENEIVSYYSEYNNSKIKFKFDNISNSYIEGTYVLDNPYDYGVFKINKE